MIAFFKTIIYVPLYNVLVLILNISWIDAGLATVILTILVKVVLYPLAKKATITQAKMKEKEGDLALIKEKYKDKQEQAVKTMEFYKINNINPFSSILTVLIQIPIIFSLYYIFFKSGLPSIDQTLLYSFVKAPREVSMIFLGLVDVSQKSIVLALLAAVTSFWQMHLASATTNKLASVQNSGPLRPSVSVAKEDFAQMITKQMKYTMPLIVFFISWKISAIVALYWFVSNLAGVAQDVYVRRQMAKTA
ncbi:MAG: YidC/Oxa1 family membrane protein insertase [Candidatus Paceibacterota bacterium]|jgi:YidC/Oxa1 family membrane protein insertase